MVNGVLLKPLPYPDADRLVGVWHTAPGMNIPLLNQSPATYFTYREEGRVFEDIGLWDNTSVSVTGTGEPERIQALLVTRWHAAGAARAGGPRAHLQQCRRQAGSAGARAPDPGLLAAQNGLGSRCPR